jgi:hypothetical protein
MGTVMATDRVTVTVIAARSGNLKTALPRSQLTAATMEIGPATGIMGTRSLTAINDRAMEPRRESQLNFPLTAVTDLRALAHSRNRQLCPPTAITGQRATGLNRNHRHFLLNQRSNQDGEASKGQQPSRRNLPSVRAPRSHRDSRGKAPSNDQRPAVNPQLQTGQRTRELRLAVGSDKRKF